MSPELAEICGIHAGDGYLRIRRRKIELDLTGHVEEKGYYDGHVIPMFNRVFEINLRGKVYVKGTYGFVTTNDGFKIFNFLGFPYGKKSKIVEVPKLILNNKDKIFYQKLLYCTISLIILQYTKQYKMRLILPQYVLLIS